MRPGGRDLESQFVKVPPKRKSSSRDQQETIPQLVMLDEPRGLTTIERQLVHYLLEPPYGDDELRAQARRVTVIGTCSCGCASVALGVDRASPRSEMSDWEPEGPHDLTAYQVKSRGLGAQVTLHVADGYLVELEIWSGAYGIRPRLDLARLKRVQEIDWE
jgi:hypothetical protein